MATDSQWYKDAVIYELHVRAFQDSDGDGLGDFAGLTQRLDYLQDLGVTALWLLPFYPSPLRDDGYDIADYTDVHPDYGTLADFRRFLDEAHRRGLRVITELVLNHTSDQHPWFQRARRAAAGSAERDFYVWADATADGEPPSRYCGARIIFPDFEQANWTWDPVAKAFYWHRFYSHQPDLNFDSPHVREALFPVVDFWLEMGVDGMRLDAVPYLFEREGTHCENLPETYDFLRALRSHIDEKFEGRMLLAEANQWPEDAVAYFGSGDLCHMAFHFPLMPRLFMALRTEDRFPIVDILAQTPTLPDGCQWALFLRNHDELPLEMVTDEERDYMNRAYANDPQARINLGIRRRLAPLLGNDRRRIELMNALLFSLPGTPVVYYGDEIGMGDNVYLGDRDSVRTPMQWSPDRNAGFSKANPQRLFLPIVIDPQFHFEAVNVEGHEANPHSLLAWMKRLIALRKRYKSLGRGDLEFIQIENQHILAFVRSLGSERVLFVANLSRYPQPFTFEPGPYAGLVPVELYGRGRFPVFEDTPYGLSLGPHSFYWFAIETPQEHAAAHIGDASQAPPAIELEEGWRHLFERENWRFLEDAVREYTTRRSDARRPRSMRRTEIADVIPFGEDYLVILNAEPAEGAAETLLFALAFAQDADSIARQGCPPETCVARLGGPESGILYDAIGAKDFSLRLLDFIGTGESLAGLSGQILASRSDTFDRLPEMPEAPPRLLQAEQSNTSIVYGESLILKLFRRIDGGVHPDLEIGRFLSERTDFAHSPALMASLEYRRGRNEPMTLGIVHEFIRHAVSGWQHALQALEDDYGRIADAKEISLELPASSPLVAAQVEVPDRLRRLIGESLEDAKLIGRRTAEMHVALTSVRDDPDFTPEAFSPLDQRSLYQSLRNESGRMFPALRRSLSEWPDASREQAERLVELETALLARFQRLLDRRITAQRTRVHGDYHLGQLLWSAGELWVIDFEGDPTRSLSARRQRLSPLTDVSSLIWSLHYATIAATETVDHLGSHRSLPRWGRVWHHWVAAALMQSYLGTAAQASFLPRNADELQVLFDCLLLGRGIHDLRHRLRHSRYAGTEGAAATLAGLLPLVDGSDGI